MAQEPSTAAQGARIFSLPPRWRFGIIAVLPFAIGALALELVVPDSALCANAIRAAFPETIFIDRATDKIGHIGDRLNYAALAFIQLTSGLIVVGFYVHLLRRLDPTRKVNALKLAILTAVAAFVVIAAVRAWGSAYDATYPYIRNLLYQAEFTRDFTTPLFKESSSKPLNLEGEVCSEKTIEIFEGITPTSLVVGVPFALGVIAVILAVSVAAAAASFGGIRGPEWEREFRARIQVLQRAFYALSIMLVTSTISVMMFMQLPGEIIADANSSAKADLLRYAKGMTVFWGATMTITLVATFAPSMIALRQHAKRQHESMTTNVSFEEWFSQQVPTSARRQIANLTTLLAPLLIGPLGSAVQSAFTGG